MEHKKKFHDEGGFFFCFGFGGFFLVLDLFLGSSSKVGDH
jgi:hypothetical protein